MSPEETVARMFVACARQRRENRAGSGYVPEPLLAAWLAWDDVRDQCARLVAEDVVHGWSMLAEDAAAYSLAVERLTRARDRYVARQRKAAA